MAKPVRRGAASRSQQPSWGAVVAVLGVVAAAAAGYFRLPGLAVLWLALLIAAWMEPPAIMTGSKDSAGFPTPAHPGEERNLRRSYFWRFCKFRLLVPNSAWLPGWPILGVFLAALVCAAAAGSLPVSTLVPYAHLVNAAAAFIVVVTVTAGRRANTPEGPGCPGTRVDSIGKLLSNPAGRFVVGAGVVLGAAAAWAVWTQVPRSGPWAPPIRALAVGAAATLVLTVIVARPWQSAALARWRMLCEWGGIWDGRWKGIKIDPPPRLTEHREVGPAMLEEFVAPSALGSQAFWSLAGKITPSVGAGVRVAILDIPDTDRKGEPQPGTRHPLRFQVVSWPSAEMPDLTSGETPTEVADLFARSAFAWTTDGLGYGRAVLVSAEPISMAAAPNPEPPTQTDTDDTDRGPDDSVPVSDAATAASPLDMHKMPGTPAPEPDPAPTRAWASSWTFPAGPTLAEIRPLVDSLAGNFGCEVLVDHKNNTLFYGALTAETTMFNEGDAARKALANLSREDQWTHIWSQVLKQGSNPPTVQHITLRTMPLPGRGVQPSLTQLGFVTRMGIDPAEYAGLESKLSTALNAAPFVSVVGWPARGEPKGARHPQAFGVVWSDGPVPGSPAELADGEASQWVLAGRINSAFSGARLARPEMAGARILTTRTSPGHIWEITVRLYGGVTLSDVRGAAARIQRSLGVPWLRIAQAESGCTIFAGVKPDKATLAMRSRDEMRLLTLDWNQAFIDAKVTGNNGLLPDLTNKGALPKNAAVQVLDFTLPPGLDVAWVKAGIAKLRVATGNDFVEVRPGSSGASSLRLLVATVNPLPTRVAFDFADADQCSGLAFATGIDGETVFFDPSIAPHCLLAGTTGSGKSVLAQNFLYGAALKNAEIYVIDPVKGGADFAFVKPWAQAFASDPFQAAAVMKAVYAKVVQRKNANASAGVGSYLDLPDPPPAIYLLIDEFTSLMSLSPVPKPSEDPEMELEREQILAENAARTTIGVLAGKLGREARSAGVTLLLATQKLTAKMLDTIPGAGDLKVNLARVLLGKASFGDRASALRAFDDAPLLEGDIPKGRGLWEPLTSSAAVIQVWYAPQAELAANLAARRTPLSQEQKLDLAPFMPKGVDPSQVAGAIIGLDPRENSHPAAAVDEPAEVNDLGEISFDLSELDDLLDDETDPDDGQDGLDDGVDGPDGAGALFAAADPVTSSARDPSPAMSAPEVPEWSGPDPVHTDALLCLDVAGVLDPIAPTDLTAGGWDDWRSIDGDHAGATMAAPRCSPRWPSWPCRWPG